MAAGTCKYCACTETTPCVGGCGWANDEQTICTVCQEAADTARELVNVLGITLTKGGAMRMVTARFDLLPIEQQTVLVMTCRTMVDSIREAVWQAVSADAMEAIVQVNLLTGFLLEHFADRISEEGQESSAELAMRLLEPHVGSRIVVPAGSTRP